jgi:hypothetical protein
MQTPVAVAQMFKFHEFKYVGDEELRAVIAAPGRPIPPEIRAEIKPRSG